MSQVKELTKSFHLTYKRSISAQWRVFGGSGGGVSPAWGLQTTRDCSSAFSNHTLLLMGRLVFAMPCVLSSHTRGESSHWRCQRFSSGFHSYGVVTGSVFKEVAPHLSTPEVLCILCLRSFFFRQTVRERLSVHVTCGMG